MNEKTLLYRQIITCHVQDGYVSSAAFRPRKCDNDKLSVYDGDKITPEQAFHHYTGNSEGILAVSMEECEEQGVKVLEDYQTHPYHVLVDFAGKTNHAIRKISEYLRDAAVSRGWLFRKE